MKKLEEEDNLIVVGATLSPLSELAEFREATGASYPILHGLSKDTWDAYEITGVPSIVVLHADGTVAGRDEGTIDKCIEAQG